MKKNILIISYSYPPSNVPAAQRPYAVAKYLDKEKFERLDKSLPLECDIPEWKSNNTKSHLPNPRQMFDQSYWSIITERDFYNQTTLV